MRKREMRPFRRGGDWVNPNVVALEGAIRERDERIRGEAERLMSLGPEGARRAIRRAMAGDVLIERKANLTIAAAVELVTCGGTMTAWQGSWLGGAAWRG